MSATNKNRLVKGMRWAARVIGLPVTFFGFMFAAVTDVPSFLGGSFLILYVVIALAGCIISWRRVRLAGILLVLTFIGLITVGILAGGPFDYPERFSLSFILANIMQASIFGSPFLVAGVLFLLSWRLSRKISPSALSAFPTS